MRWLDREGSRTTLVVALLVATFFLTAFIAVRAQLAATYYQATAEKVVRDWTRFANDELMQRAEGQANFYGAYQVLQMMAAYDSLLTPEDLRHAAKTDEMRRNVKMVRQTFRFIPGQPLVTSGLDPTSSKWLLSRLTTIIASPPRPAERQPLLMANRTFAWFLATEPEHIVGFEVDPDPGAAFVPVTLSMHTLLPPSLGDGRIGNDAVVIRVYGTNGRQLFATAGTIDPRVAVRQRAEEGLLRGLTFETSITPEAARMLIVGGIPRPLRIYLLLLAVNAALLITAILQLRKERALTRMRSELMSSVSHELRTPLTQIRMFAETLLLDRVRSDDERRRSLVIIDQESRRLTHLVENVLQFSRGERGTLRVERRPSDLNALVRDTIEAFTPIAAARGTKITFASTSDATVAMDEEAVRQVILNLLDNAVKYGPASQELIVELGRLDDVVRLSVEDQGPGVPPRDRNRIWKRYERLERERERAIAGAGIGLSVVWDIVALHGGRAWVEDGSRGGARFVVMLPAEISR